MTTVLELRQNRAFINTNFQGYKLSLDPIATIKQELNIPPLKAKPSEDQYSYFHAELFALYNSLIQDQWNRNNSYFINEIGEIIKCSYDESTGKPKLFHTVYKLNNISSRQVGDFPVVLQFISEDLCIISDGIGEIELLDTNDRSQNTEWRSIFKHRIVEFQKFMIKDSRLDVINDRKVVNCLLQHISCSEQSGHSNELKHCILELNNENNTWTFLLKNTWICKGSLNYCTLEVGGGGIIVCTNKEFKLKNDVEELKNKKDAQTVEIPNKLSDTAHETQKDESSPPSPSYSWSQTDSDVTIKLNKAAIDDKDFKVITTKTKLTVKSCDVSVLEGELFGKIDSDVTTWTRANDYFEIVLVKEQENLHWPYLIVDGPPETVEDKKQTTDFLNPMFGNQPVANLQSQMEECDYSTNSIDEEYTLVRINLNSLKHTHKVFLGKHPPLFSTYLEKSNPPAIAIRQDVDACIWSFQTKQNIQESNNENNCNENEFNLNHEGNLHAFGYIQASKQQKKFVNCSSDLQFVAICESYRHIFIYKLNYGGSNELRNRNGPQVTIGKQHVVTLNDDDGNAEILGMSITNNFVVLLTEKNLVYLQIN